MENLSSFPLCHSSSPPKGLKHSAENREGAGTQRCEHAPGEQRVRKKFKAILIVVFEFQVFCCTGGRSEDKR